MAGFRKNSAENNKPKDFTGAIGNFGAILNDPATRTIEVGEPITISLSITGKGNFDRISAPQLTGEKIWKIYDPKSDFTPTDQFGYEGTKTFEYILIPQKEGQLNIPPVAFNFFNPEKKMFETIEIPSIPVTVTPSPQGSSTFTQTPTPGSIKSEEVDIPQAKHLLGIQREIGTWHYNTLPVFTRPRFLAWQL